MPRRRQCSRDGGGAVIARALVALVFLVSLSSCTKAKTEEVVGTWHIVEASRGVLPAQLKTAPATIVLSGDGRFAVSALPGFLNTPSELDSGEGVWKLTSRDGKQEVQLEFQSRQGEDAARVPYGATLEISKGLGNPTLYYFIGDPDEGRMIEFERAK